MFPLKFHINKRLEIDNIAEYDHIELIFCNHILETLKHHSNFSL